MGKASDAELAFAHWWRVLGGPALETEFRFHPPRRWRADFAHEAARVLIEIEGGVWSGGRHTRGAGFENDAAKYNQAALDGWAVFRLTPGMIDRDPEGVLRPIMALIAHREAA